MYVYTYMYVLSGAYELPKATEDSATTMYMYTRVPSKYIFVQQWFPYLESVRLLEISMIYHTLCVQL